VRVAESVSAVFGLAEFYIGAGAVIGLFVQPWLKPKWKMVWQGLALGFGASGVLLLVTTF
jgi:hypothetical protein